MRFDTKTAVSGIGALDAPADDILARIASSDCAVLVTGETGVGKGFLARWIHDNSARSASPCIAVNCGAIPESLIDSQLFGHVRGSFSGATGDHSGLVRAAEGGTLLLDEVGELPMGVQVRLLRLLEEREVQPVGMPKPVGVDVRIIAATATDLHDAVNSGTFRADLFYRLDVLRIHLKPLRDRPADLDPLLGEFNEEFARLYGQPPLRFAPRAMAALRRYTWPGNVRELRAVIERLHVLCPGQRITAEQLLEHGQLPESESSSGTRRLEEARLAVVDETLRACDGNISHAASTLGVHRSTLYRWLARGPES